MTVSPADIVTLAKLDVGHGEPPDRRLRRRIEPQQLIDRDPAELGARLRQRLRPGQQRDQTIAEQVRGVLVAREQDQERGGRQLVLAEPVLLVPSLDEGAEHVVPGAARLAAMRSTMKRYNEASAQQRLDPCPRAVPHDPRPLLILPHER
jgi:hypothetical protein